MINFPGRSIIVVGIALTLSVLPVLAKSSLPHENILVGTQAVLPVSQEEVRELELAAETGDVESQYRLGMALFYGAIVDIDKEKAAHWLLKAAQQGHRFARVAVMQISSTEVSCETKKELDAWTQSYQKDQAVRHGLLPK